MKESEYIEGLKQGNRGMFSALYDRYWKQVYNFTRLYITSSSDAEEVVQEVFLKLWESRGSLDETKSIEGFLFIITRNLIFDLSRKRFNEASFKMTAIQALEQSYTIEEEMDASDLKTYIDKLVAVLPPRQQEVFRMSREKHLSNREIAERLAITEKAVERHMTLALKFLKKNLSLFMLFISI